MSNNTKQHPNRNNAGKPQFDECWIVNGPQEDDFNDYCKFKGEELANNKLTSTQFRNFFNEVKRIEMNGFDSQAVTLLMPKLHYMEAKAKGKKGVKLFFELVQPALDCVNKGVKKECSTDEAKASNDSKNQNSKAERFANFVNYLEALLAYHKFHGGD